MNNLLAKDLVVNAKENKYGLVIEQKQSRQLKAQLTNAVAELLRANYDVDTVMTVDGLYVMIPNENEGVIPVLVDVKMKPLDTDVDALAQELVIKQENKAKAAAEKAKKATSPKN